MALNFAGATTLTAGGVAVVSLDASGVLSVPNRPICWLASGTTAYAVGSDIILSVVGYNVGNCYNTSNGRFTAPIAGVYHVMWRQLAQNASAAQSYVFGLYVNGNYYIKSWTNKMAVNTWNSNSFRTHVYLNAGDYCTLRYLEGNSTTYTESAYSQFSVQLVG